MDYPIIDMPQIEDEDHDDKKNENFDNNLLVVNKQDLVKKTRTRSNSLLRPNQQKFPRASSPALSKLDSKPAAKQSWILSRYKTKKNSQHDLHSYLDAKIIDHKLSGPIKKNLRNDNETVRNFQT